MPVTHEEKINEIRQTKRKKEAARIMKQFLQDYGDNIIKMSQQYKSENGLGALFITLVPDSKELDTEYFKLDDLDGAFKQKILDDPHSENSVYYAIRLHDQCYQFQRKLK